MATSFETGAYSPSDIQINLSGAPIQGFPEGAFLSAKFDSPAVVIKQGADMTVAKLIKGAGRLATVTIRVMQTALANDILYGFFTTQAASGAVAGPMLSVLNSASGENLLMADATILDTPELSYSDDIEVREWVFQGRTIIVYSGNPIL